MSPDFSTLNPPLSTFNRKTLASNKLTLLRRDNFVKVLTIIEVHNIEKNVSSRPSQEVSPGRLSPGRRRDRRKAFAEYARSDPSPPRTGGRSFFAPGGRSFFVPGGVS